MRETTMSAYEEYLYFSYIPKAAEADLEWLNCDLDYDFGIGAEDEKWWIQEGVKALKKTMADQLACTDQRALHILPLSGGLDSRAILGGLLENLPHSQLIAATYGIPGAWDFEIAKLIAGEFGIRHETFDLTDDKWDIDQLVKAASRLKYPVSVYQSYVRQKINNHFGIDCVYWSGFLGGAVTGTNLPKIPSASRLEAVERQLNIEPTPNYKDETFQSEISHKICAEFQWDRLHNKKFSLDQQLYFCFRQKLLTQPIVVVNDFKFMTPFLDKTWVNFMSNVPYKWLQGQYLYKRIIIESYRKLSRLPSRTMAGMPLDASKYRVFVGKALRKVKPLFVQQRSYRLDPRTNYLNFSDSLRYKRNLQDSVHAMLQDLKKRQIFDDKDLDHWWFDHLRNKTDYAVLLINLSSLELLLKVGLL
jgi:hypothetical protein